MYILKLTMISLTSKVIRQEIKLPF